MTTGELRDLFAYGVWANALVFKAADVLPDDQQGKSVESSFPSVAGTLGHIVGAEWVWLRRWLGESPTAFPDWVVKPRVPDLRTRLSEVERERAAFVAGLADDDLGRPVSYLTLSGKPFTDPLGHLMQHVVNHSTYHRGQVATQLRHLGHKPPSTDLIVYLREPK